MFPTAWPLPSGATAVPILTMRHVPPTGPHDVYADACPAVETDSFLVEYDPASGVTYRHRTTAVTVMWPEGYSARLNPGLEIVAPDGEVFVRAGEYTSKLVVTPAESGVLRACIFGNGPRRVGTP